MIHKAWRKKAVHLGRGIRCCFLFCFLFFGIVFAAIPDRPAGYVSDYANVLSYIEKTLISDSLARYEKATTNQVVVVIVPTLEGMTIEDYSIRLAEKWKIGHIGKNNGVILLIATSEKKITMAVGHGLVPYLTDAACGNIIRTVIGPRLDEKKFYEGIMNGVQAITATIDAKRMEEKPAFPPRVSKDVADAFWGFIFYLSAVPLKLVLLIWAALAVGIESAASSSNLRKYPWLSPTGEFFITIFMSVFVLLAHGIAAAAIFLFAIVGGMVIYYIRQGTCTYSSGSGRESKIKKRLERELGHGISNCSGGSGGSSGGAESGGGGSFGGGGASGGW